jgi:hypothetical protein
MATGAPGRECISFMHPLVGVIMRCTSPCDRCRTLAQEYADAAPERERARQEYEATNPMKAPKPHIETVPTFPPTGRGRRLMALPYIETLPLTDAPGQASTPRR